MEDDDDDDDDDIVSGDSQLVKSNTKANSVSNLRRRSSEGKSSEGKSSDEQKFANAKNEYSEDILFNDDYGEPEENAPNMLKTTKYLTHQQKSDAPQPIPRKNLDKYNEDETENDDDGDDDDDDESMPRYNVGANYGAANYVDDDEDDDDKF